jgi:two-component system, LytTR family, response regulator LytT
MQILIIEDELKAARSLAAALGKLRPSATIVAQLQSIERAVDHLTHHPQPDLIFMDVQLADGLCFEIFKAVKITCPVIFCTAFGEYALDAIKANGVDYVLKPYSAEDLQKALQRVDDLRNFFQQTTSTGVEDVLKKIGLQEGKRSFLVFKHNKYTTVPTDQIACFSIRHETTLITTFQGEEWTLDQSLDQVQASLSPRQFYRLNRQYIVNFNAVKEVEHYFTRKLAVKLTVATAETLLIGKEKTTAFLRWLEER